MLDVSCVTVRLRCLASWKLLVYLAYSNDSAQANDSAFLSSKEDWAMMAFRPLMNCDCFITFPSSRAYDNGSFLVVMSSDAGEYWTLPCHIVISVVSITSTSIVPLAGTCCRVHMITSFQIVAAVKSFQKL
jgi:hypothetical protein